MRKPNLKFVNIKTFPNRTFLLCYREYVLDDGMLVEALFPIPNDLVLNCLFKEPSCFKASHMHLELEWWSHLLKCHSYFTCKCVSHHLFWLIELNM